MARALRLLVLVSALLPIASGFAYVVPRSRWTLPYESLSQEGLSRSLRFAVHPEFCRLMQPRFIETHQLPNMEFVGCEELAESIHRAFQAWSFNHKRISFVNSSDLCGEAEAANRSCDAVEIYISAAARRAESQGGAVVTTALDVSTQPPRDTSSDARLVPGDRTIRRASIEFAAGNDFMWYLDTAYCHALMQRDFDVEGLMLAAYSICTVLGVGLLLYRLAVLLHAERTKGKEYAFKILMVMLSRFIVTWSIGALIIFPNVLYFGILAPCLDSYSFEAAAVHSVGIALGIAPLSQGTQLTLMVRSAAEETNMETKLRMNNETCRTASLLPDEPGSALRHALWSEECATRQHWTCRNRHFSVMLPPAPHHTEVCLTDDDLDALNWLYPTCEAANSRPICVRSSRNQGWLKFVIMGGVPFMVVALLSFCGLVLVRRRQAKRMRKMHTMEVALTLWGDKAKKIFDREEQKKRELRQKHAHHLKMPGMGHLLHHHHHNAHSDSGRAGSPGKGQHHARDGTTRGPMG